MYRARFRKFGWRWWVTVDRDHHIVGSNVCITLAGARRWARRRAAQGLRYSPPVEFTEEVA